MDDGELGRVHRRHGWLPGQHRGRSADPDRAATHPGIGLLAVTVTAEMATATGLVRGALGQQVVPSLGAAPAGIRAGDVITRVGGTPVNSVDQMLVAIRARNPGETVQLTYVRNGTQQSTNGAVSGS